MPAAITHYLHAERVMEILEKSEKIEPVQRQAFLWGAQGPDFLYYHRILPWQQGASLKEYGGKLHRDDPALLFDAMREYYCASANDRILLFYLYGFICHYSLDRICHPFVYFGTQILLDKNSDQNKSSIHSQIESYLDTIMLRYEKAELPIEFNLKWTVPKSKQVQIRIAELYSYVLNQLYGAELDVTQLLQATQDCRTVYGLLNDRTTLKKNLMERLEKHNIINSVSSYIRPVSEGDQYDYANILKAEWEWPYGSGKKSHQSFFELYELSILESEKLICKFFDERNFDNLLQEIPFV
jgi:hypothetical protein